MAETRAQLAFVTTNSVVQGEHVGLMFPMILAKGIEIGFAYTSFKWANNAKKNAGVTVAVVGLRVKSSDQKFIYTDDLRIEAGNINGYLADGDNIFIGRRSKPLYSELPPMLFGNMALDQGNLLLTAKQRDELLGMAPEASRFIRLFTDEGVVEV